MADLFGRNDFDPKAFLKHADELEAQIPPKVARFDAKDKTGRRVLETIMTLIERLSALGRALDPVEHLEILDVTKPEIAGEMFAHQLLQKPREKLVERNPFYGAGVYAIYYTGSHPAYLNISSKEIPIYVGKADPASADATSAQGQGTKLFSRLFKEHLKSIRAAEAYAKKHPDLLKASGAVPIVAEDFECRYIGVTGSHAVAVEQILINKYKPVWNIVSGFGKHGDSATTRSNTRSDWDTIHPGRPWATSNDNQPNPLKPKELHDRILALTVEKKT